MSVRMAIAKLTAAAAGGAVVGGGAVHVAEPQSAQVSYKSDKADEGETELVYVKGDGPTARRTIPPLPREQLRLRRTIETECCVEEVAALGAPLPLPPLPSAPISGGGSGQPIIIGGSGGFGGGFGGGFFGGFFGGSGGGGSAVVDMSTTTTTGGTGGIDIDIDNDNSSTGSSTSTSSGGSSTSTSGGSTSTSSGAFTSTTSTGGSSSSTSTGGVTSTTSSSTGESPARRAA